jgi:bacillithiol synthase
MESIPFEDFPSTFHTLSSLYRTYVTNFEHVEKFYNGSYADLPGQTHVLERAAKRPLNRAQIGAILEEQQKRYGMGKESETNALLLQQENTYAVVTGQQVGLFGGPLYTVYKIITALKLTEEANRLFPELSFVPVFYLEAEDHDYDEISTITLANTQNELQSFRYYPDGKPFERNAGSVGSIEFSDTIASFIDDIYLNLVPTDFRESVIELLHQTYRPGVDFATAFARYIHTMFPHSGLVMLDPRDRALKQLVRPLIRKELDEHPRTSEIVIRRSAVLEEHYHAQAKPRAINMFLNHRGGRYLIEPRDKEFGLKGARQRFTRDDLLRMVDESPELFSPNVLLRPIFQDYLLPTFVYVGGPSEIAYFAQLKEVYHHFDVTMPIIYPRASATIIEEKVKRVMEKFEISPFDFFTDLELLQKNVTSRLSDVNLEDVFKSSTARLEDNLRELRYALQTIDPTLSGAYENARKKIEYQINRLKQKSYDAQRKNFSTAMRQIEKAAIHVAPNGFFQERLFPLLQFCNKYSLDFPKWLTERVDINNFEHQLYYR